MINYYLPLNIKSRKNNVFDKNNNILKIISVRLKNKKKDKIRWFIFLICLFVRKDILM